MSEKRKRKRKIGRIIFIVLLVLLGFSTGAFFLYTADYSRAQETALEAMAGTEVTTFDGGMAFGASDATEGFVFYPGGKVEYSAYAPLMQKLAAEKVFCVILKMPFNLAVFDTAAAADIPEKFPEVKQWYIGGHSLGGVMAADYAAKHSQEFAGLILLASYPASDISDSGLKVLSIYGSEDRVLNLEKYNESKSLLPTDYQELCIEGGNHGQFGDYGLQDGDGTATITAAKQWEITAQTILGFIREDSE